MKEAVKKEMMDLIEKVIPLFLNFTSISFFIPPINTVFYLIEH